MDLFGNHPRTTDAVNKEEYALRELGTQINMTNARPEIRPHTKPIATQDASATNAENATHDAKSNPPEIQFGLTQLTFFDEREGRWQEIDNAKDIKWNSSSR